MASSQKHKKGRSKPPQGRPTSTSTISQPVVEGASHLTVLSSFSPKGNLFAFLSLAVDKHRLRVYNTVSGQSVAEHVVDSARVSTLTWSMLNSPSEAQTPSLDDETAQPSKKKRKKRNSGAAEEDKSHRVEVVLLGLTDGTVSFFSPVHGRILKTLSHASSTSSILSADSAEEDHATIWTSGADATLRLWDVQRNDILASWKNEDRIPYTSLAVRPTSEPGRIDILAAHHSIRLLSKNTDSADFNPKTPKQLSSFIGHASPITLMRWDSSKSPSERFLTIAEADRYIYIWEAVDGSSSDKKAVASVTLDSDARTFALSNSPSGRQILATLSASGNISVYPIPQELVPAASSSGTSQKIPTLLSRSNLVSSSKHAVQTMDVSVTHEDGNIRVARLVKGVRPVFDIIRYLDDSGEYIPDIVMADIDVNSVNEQQPSTLSKRYAEPSSVVMGSGIELGGDEEIRDVDGDLEVDLAEMSLGQRLTAVSEGDPRRTSDSDEEDSASKPKSSSKKAQSSLNVVPANSLTRTLIQALHSSDTRLLETCLAHSDSILIRNTVRRLPPQLAIPLITACVERLSRGARAANMKGGGGGASSQRGTGLITWIKTVLAIHAGHLMTVPELVTRLSGLHNTLTARLTLHESLLSLSGRLDMVLSQIEMRASAAPATLAPRKGKAPAPSTEKKEVKRYVEGESESSESEGDRMDVEVESGDDEGSIEDVELGGSSDEDEDDALLSEEDDDEEDDDSEGPTMNGFIDDEAEEYSEEDDEDSE